MCRSWRSNLYTIRLLSTCLMLEIEIHRAGIWERKMDVQRKNTNKLRPQQAKLKAVLVLLPAMLVVWITCKSWALAMELTTHSWPGVRARRAWEKRSSGRCSQCRPQHIFHQWGGWRGQRVQLTEIPLCLCPPPAVKGALYKPEAPPKSETNTKGNSGDCGSV